MSGSSTPRDYVAGTSFPRVSECNCVIEELLVMSFCATSLTVVSKCRPTTLVPDLISKENNLAFGRKYLRNSTITVKECELMIFLMTRKTTRKSIMKS